MSAASWSSLNHSATERSNRITPLTSPNSPSHSPMVRVTLLNASEYLHRASGVRFRPAQVGDVWLGVAEVDEAVAAEHFASRPELFRVEELPSRVVATCEEAPDFAAME